MPPRIGPALLNRPYRPILSSNAPPVFPLQQRPPFPTRIPCPPTRQSSSSSTPAAGKGIFPQKPDKIQPPSHPARKVAPRKRPPPPGPPVPEAEKQVQVQAATQPPPPVPPSIGTRVYEVVTSRLVHMWLTLTVLFAIGSTTLMQNFLSTSPFGHLTPPIRRLATSPASFLGDWVAVMKLHMDDKSQRAHANRMRDNEDVQKRRLYRRAHGMEDVDIDGIGTGVDVEGLVPWDDGLTTGERRRRMKAARKKAREEEAEAGPGAESELVEGEELKSLELGK